MPSSACFFNSAGTRLIQETPCRLSLASSLRSKKPRSARCKLPEGNGGSGLASVCSESRRARLQRLELAGGDLKADQKLQAGLARLGVGATAAGELPGQFRRQPQAGAVIDHHAGEPPQQWDGLGAGGEEPLQRLLDDPPEAIGGAGVQPLIEALLGDVEFVPQFVDGGRGIVEPAEDQSLHEAGPGNLPSALNHPRFFGGGVGLGGEQGLQSLGQFALSRISHRAWRIRHKHQR